MSGKSDSTLHAYTSSLCGLSVYPDAKEQHRDPGSLIVYLDYHHLQRS